MQRKQDFKQMLRRSGHKATTPRLAILAVFSKSKAPMSAQEVIEVLPPGIDQATVYRTFKFLRETGVITQIDLRHNHAHYELSNLAEHHHLICTGCGRIEDVRHCNIQEVHAPILRSSKHFTAIREHALEFYGTCKSCARKEGIPPNKPLHSSPQY